METLNFNKESNECSIFKTSKISEIRHWRAQKQIKQKFEVIKCEDRTTKISMERNRQNIIITLVIVKQSRQLYMESYKE